MTRDRQILEELKRQLRGDVADEAARKFEQKLQRERYGGVNTSFWF